MQTCVNARISLDLLGSGDQNCVRSYFLGLTALPRRSGRYSSTRCEWTLLGGARPIKASPRMQPETTEMASRRSKSNVQLELARPETFRFVTSLS
jgi:hypothetical protein